MKFDSDVLSTLAVRRLTNVTSIQIKRHYAHIYSHRNYIICVSLLFAHDDLQKYALAV